MSCSHSKKQPDRWVVLEDEWDGTDRSYWEYGLSYSTFADIDTHRMRCTQCGKIEYYSGRAREHYENGTSFPGIAGLE